MGAITKTRFPSLWNDILLRNDADNGPERDAVHVPDVEIEKSKDAYRVRAVLPDVRREDINVEVKDGYLILSGSYAKREDSDYKSVYSERVHYAEFRRALRIEDGRFDADQVKAKLDRGVLTVKLPLRAEAKPRQIEVKVV